MVTNETAEMRNLTLSNGAAIRRYALTNNEIIEISRLHGKN